ncbi:unnamed protein product [Symbiodinium pilosum]|uniref:EF-hand domain-containing protein n=1 Tax=Symbiodinium pilosum TaxID=2952 RepID=A0A812UI12_SYMPI|nr:unnamed protein product [Symbiodinium pilosum]
MSWDDEAKPCTATTSAGVEMPSLPSSAQVTSEAFLSQDRMEKQEQRLAGPGEEEFRSTKGMSSSQGCSPRDPRWRDAQLKERLNTARTLRKAVEHQFKAKPKPATKDWAGTGVAHKLRKRVLASETLAHLLMQRIEGTELLIRRVNQTLSFLTREHVSLKSPIEMCHRRLVLRNQRPEEENVEDEFQVALEREERVLSSSSKHLSSYIDAGESLKETLTAAKDELVEDMQFKRHALRLEKSALQFDPYHGRDRACVLPMVAESSKVRKKQSTATADGNVQSGYDMPPFKFGTTHKSLDRETWSEDSTENIQRSVKHTHELLERTQEFEKDASKFLDHAAELVSRVKQQVKNAREACQSSMQASIFNLSQQKRELEEGVAQGQLDVNRTEVLLQHMQQEIRSQKASLEQWDETQEIPLQKFDQRLPLAIQQDMRLSAVDRMQEQMHNTRSNVHILSNKCEETRELLSQLRSSHELLQKHLTAVTASWNLDMQCSKIMLSKDVTASSLLARTASFVPSGGQLSKESLDLIRSRIKAAAYVGPKQGFDVIFKRFDKDGSGTLCFEEVRSALRRILRIPTSSLNDHQISSLCKTLDSNDSGSVDIAELVAFLGAAPLEEKLKNDGLGKIGDSSLQLDCFVNRKPRHNKSQCAPKPIVGLSKNPLPQSVVETLRSKIKAAAYNGQLGREIRALFSRFDYNGSGVLEADEVRQVLRRAMRIPPSVISDQQIWRLCAMLDVDKSGAISISELTQFVGKEP